ncbi:MAG: hypothetical protein R3F59_06760 [Myxococcota bacterium]
MTRATSAGVASVTAAPSAQLRGPSGAWGDAQAPSVSSAAS